MTALAQARAWRDEVAAGLAHLVDLEEDARWYAAYGTRAVLAPDEAAAVGRYARTLRDAVWAAQAHLVAADDQVFTAWYPSWEAPVPWRSPARLTGSRPRLDPPEQT